MDKNTVTGFILIGLVLIGFSWYSRPSQAELEQMAREDSIAAVQQAEAEAKALQEVAAAESQKAGLLADSTSLFFNHRNGEAGEVVLQNEKVKITLGTQGAAVQRAEIIGYKSRRVEGDVVLLNKEDAQLNFSLSGKQENISLQDFFFTVVGQTDSTATLRLQQGEKMLTVSYSLRSDSYMLDMTVAAEGLAGFFAPDSKTMYIDWKDHLQQQEKGYDFENQYSSLTYKIKDEGTDHLSEASDDEQTLSESLDWVAFKNQFFSAVLIAPQDFTGVSLTSTQEKKEKGEKTGYLKTYEAHMQTAFDPTGKVPTTLQMYLGPNDFHVLQEHNDLSLTDKDLDLEELVYLGWSLFRWINRWTILYIFDWLAALGLPMGVVLLLLTVIVKIFVYPTTKKSYISGAKMRVLKPQIDAISAKYPKAEDAMKKQQETMTLYSQYGVSPMGGCLPMLIQMPIWLALFNFVPNAIALRGESFLWADDLSAYDDVISWGKDIWLIGDHLSLFCILFCLTNIINTWVSMRQQQNQFSGEQAQQMKMMQYMMYIMPLTFFFIFNNYSSGLNYYYFLSGLTSILIMWYLRKTTDEKKLLAKLEAYRQQHKNDPKKLSGMAARLEALQKMQEEQQKKLKK